MKGLFTTMVICMGHAAFLEDMRMTSDGDDKKRLASRCAWSKKYLCLRFRLLFGLEFRCRYMAN